MQTRLMRQSMAFLAAALGAAVLMGKPARAGDEGLYGPNAPPQSAFVRVFNATTAPIAGATLDSQPFDNAGPFEATEFEFTTPGTHTIVAGGARQAVDLDKNRFYTAVVRGDKITLIENERYSNRMKSLVLVYNLIDGTNLALKTADGRTTVVGPVKPNTAGGREINAVKTQLALFDGETSLAQVKPMTFERGRVFSLFVTGSQDQPMPVWVIN